YRTVSLDPSIYLHYLQSQCLSLGVTFRRVTVGHIREAFNQNVLGRSTPDVVVNCTGLWASKYGGVMDYQVVPMRGQLVIVENESHGMFSLSGDGSMKEEIGDRVTLAGGTALGGSCYLSWDREPDMALAERLMKRAIQICPQLVPEGAGIEALRVIRHQVGLRPVRSAGHRQSWGKLRVVHCYGAGGFGFQSSYGMANKAVALVGETLGWQ
ncbi:FAD dependent oxidoreductase, partial [Coniochaeta sp. 2T2.1]